MARTTRQPPVPVVRSALTDLTTKGRARTDALARVGPRGGADVSTTMTLSDHGVIACRGEDVVDLARAEFADVDTVVVDLAEADPVAAGADSFWTVGHHPLGRIGRFRDVLSPSWPSVLRLTNAFGTTDSIAAGEGPTS